MSNIDDQFANSYENEEQEDENSEDYSYEEEEEDQVNNSLQKKEINENLNESEEDQSEEEVLSQNQQHSYENSSDQVDEIVSEDDNNKEQKFVYLNKSEEITDIIKQITSEKVDEDDQKQDYKFQQPDFSSIFLPKEQSSPEQTTSLNFDFDILNVLSLNKQLQEENKTQVQVDVKSSCDSILQDYTSIITKPKPTEKIPPRTTLKYPRIMRTLEYTDFQHLLLNPLPPTGMLQCTVVRNNLGFNRFNPKFQLLVSSTQKFLIAAQKKISPSQNYYVISMHQKEISSRNAFFIGKLRSDISNNCFSLYDDGVSSIKNNLVRTARKQLAGVIYKQNSTSKKPREMKVLIPDITQNERNIKGFTCTTNEQNMITKFNQGVEQEITIFQNNQPQWDNYVQSFVLNFFGRVKQASIKNFQLVQSLDQRDNVYLQFGKVSDHEFILDFQHPFSPIQAFMIALTSFEYKCRK